VQQYQIPITPKADDALTMNVQGFLAVTLISIFETAASYCIQNLINKLPVRD